MPPPRRLLDYQVLGRIGLGATAEILLAERNGVRVALKVLHPHLRADPDVWKAFMDEARLTSRLKHPGIVEVLDLLEDGDDVFMVLELVDGPSLLGATRVASERAARVPMEVCAHVLESVAEALAFVHGAVDPGTGEALAVVHRDVAPANLLLDRSGTVKVTDFGIARSRHGKRLGILTGDTTRGGMVKGRRGYVSPEQLKGELLDGRSDIYSLGVVVWELLAGRRMHGDVNALELIEKIVHEPAAPAASLRADVPPALAALVDGMLAKQRAARMDSASAVVEAIRGWRAGRDLMDPMSVWVRSLALPSLRAAPAVMSAVR